MKFTFARVGGLSPVKYKPIKDREPNFHYPPPTKKGLYAFVWPYVEIFLWHWSKSHQKDFDVHGYRKFKYEGYVWCHRFEKDTDIYGIEFWNSWMKIHTTNLVKVFQKVMITDIKSLHECWYDEKDNCRHNLNYQWYKIDDPYKRGRGGYMSRDHLEIFIEGKDCGKIK